jgi:hypothetical protein
MLVIAAKKDRSLRRSADERANLTAIVSNHKVQLELWTAIRGIDGFRSNGKPASAVRVDLVRADSGGQQRECEP